MYSRRAGTTYLGHPPRLRHFATTSTFRSSSFFRQSVPFSGQKMEVFSKLHDESYHRQLRHAVEVEKKNLSIQDQAGAECTFRPQLAPGTAHHLKSSREYGVFSRLSDDATRVAAKHAELREKFFTETDQRESIELTFHPVTTKPPAEMEEALQRYCQASPSQRLLKAPSSKNPATNSNGVGPSDRRVFSMETAERLTRPTLRFDSQARELKERMMEMDMYTFAPTVNRRPHTSSRSARSTTPSATDVKRDPMKEVDDNPLNDPNYKKRRELLLESRAQRPPRQPSPVVSLGGRKTDPHIVASAVERLAFRPEQETAAAVARDLVDRETHESWKRELHHHQEHYYRLVADGAFQARLGHTVQRPAANPIEETVLTPPPQRGQKKQPSQGKATAERIKVRQQRALERVTKSSASSTTPIPERHEVKPVARRSPIPVKGIDDFYRRMEQSKRLAEERTKQLQTQVTAIVRETDSQGHVRTVVSPFRSLEVHERETSLRKHCFLSNYRDPECRFFPLTCRSL
jgi:hypothetical protein